MIKIPPIQAYVALTSFYLEECQPMRLLYFCFDTAQWQATFPEILIEGGGWMIRTRKLSVSSGLFLKAVRVVEAALFL